MNPYYRMLELMAGEQHQLVFATLREDTFWVEGHPAAAAGKAAGLTFGPEDAGGRFLCLQTGGGLYVLCRLEEL